LKKKVLTKCHSEVSEIVDANIKHAVLHGWLERLLASKLHIFA
jgi:hypothetical protein